MLGMIIILLLSRRRRQNYDSYKLANMIILMVLNARRRQKLSSFAIKHDSFRFVEKVEKNLTCATVVKSQT